jgi:hypothetical protein
MLKETLKKYVKVFDVILLPLIVPSALLLKMVRRIGLEKLKFSRAMLLRIGVLPIRDHYYEPLINPRHLKLPLTNTRNLPGINFNTEQQLALLSEFKYKNELEVIPDNYVNDLTFHYNNRSFIAGDAEFWYSMIRLNKPKIIIEIGSGHSTKMAQLAIHKNKSEDTSYDCKHICIEPYEMPWLEQLDVMVIRKKVEEIEVNFFKQLNANDILFIDSSHVIRPQGDVLFEYLEILPILNAGVIVHIHDLLSPRDYLKSWVVDEIKLWNEQYILEAFLTSNPYWKIVAAVNFLKNDHFEKLSLKCPKLKKDDEPGSFYIVKC